MANVKISALSTIPGNAVSGNDLFLISQTAIATSRSLSIANARIAIANANDYVTYNILSSNINSVQSNLDSYAAYANATLSNVGSGSADYVQANLTLYASTTNTRISGTEANVISLQGGIVGTNNSLSSNIAIFSGAFTGSNTRISGTESNVTSLQGGISGSNVRISGTEANVIALQSGLSGTNTALSDNVAIFSGAHTGANSRISGTEANVISLQGGIVGTNNSLSSNIAIFSGAFTGSNTRLSGVESNVVSLQGGISGSNTRLVGAEANVIALQSGISGANTNILNLIVGLLGSNTDITDLQSAISGSNTAITNLTTGLSGSNTRISGTEANVISLQSGISGANTTILNLQTGIAGTNTTISTKDSVANVYATYLSAMSNDGATLLTARSNDYSTYLTILGSITASNASIVNLQTGISGTNTNLSGNVAIFTGAFTGSNTRLAGAEANVIALQANSSSSPGDILNLQTGLAGANTAITNLTTGLSGSNTTILNVQGGITGANASIVSLQSGASGSNTRIAGAEGNVIALQSGLTGTNSTVATKDSIANVYITWNYLNANIISFASYANSTFTTNTHIDTKIAAVIDSSPEALNTLRELANALGNDSSFSATVLNQIGTISANTVALQGGLTGSNTAISTKDSIANVYATYLMSLGGLTGANTAILNLQTGLSGTNSTVATKDSIANVYATYLIAKGGIDSANTSIVNLQTGLTGSNTRITGAESNVISLQSGISGSNTAITNLQSGVTGSNVRISGTEANVISLQGGISGSNVRITGAESNVIALQGGISGSNTRISGTESNVIALQGGVSGANASIVNLQGGLTGSNTAITNLVTGLTGANTAIATKDSVANVHATYLILSGGITGANTAISNLQGGLAGSNTAIINLQSGLAGANTRISGAEANVIALQNGITGSNTSIVNLQTGLSGSNTAITNLQTGLSGSNTAIATQTTNITNLTTGLTGANTNITNLTTGLSGSNTRISGTESNVISLQGGISGSNTSIVNLQVGLLGANTSIVNLQTGLTGSNTRISGVESNVISVQGGISGSNVRISGTEANVISLQGGITGSNTNINLKANAAAPVFTGNATFDTDVLFVDSLNDRVGISTTSPTTTFDVRGTTDQYSFQVPSTGSARYVRSQTGIASFSGYNLGLLHLSGTFDSFVSVYNGAMLGALNASAWSNTNSAAHMILLTTSYGSITPSEKVRITSNGEVGIGITVPTAKLAVANGTSATTQHNYGTYTDASNYERIAVTANTTGHYIIGEEAGTGSARSLFLGANNSTAVTIDTSGNVGIGITSPTSALDINGKITTRFGGALRGYFGSPTWDTSYVAIQHGALGESASNAALHLSSSGDTTLNAASGRTLYLRINNDAGGQGQLEFTSRKFAFTGANVGIGITTPTANLHVIGTANISSTITASGVDLLSNDYATYLTALGGLTAANIAITNLQTGLSGTNTTVATKDSVANVYATYLSAMSNDGATLLSARSNDYSTYLTLLGAISASNASIVNLQTGISGTNTNLSGNVAIFTGAFTGSNTRLSGTEANVIALQANSSGSPGDILNLQTGLAGANTNIAAITNSPVTFQSNVTILGNLTISGNTTIVTANTISFGDSLLSLASNSTSDVIDIGLYGHYSGGGFSNNHTGIFRSVASQDWVFFAAYGKEEPSLTIDMANSSFALANIRVKSTNASLDISAANAVLGTSIYSGAVELRANDYATLLAAYSNDGATLLSARSNDYSTYLTLLGAITASNASIVNLQTGLSGTNTTVATKDSVANVYATYLIAKGGIDGANTSIVNLQTGLSGTNTTVATKDSVANVYATYLSAMSNDGATLLSARSNDYSTLLAAYSNDNVTLGLSYSNDGSTLLTARSNDYSTYLVAKGGIDSANTSILNLQTGIAGSNARISGTESNVISLQGGISGSNTAIVNLQGGLAGSNTNILNLQTGLAGANTNINNKANIASPVFTGNATFDTNVLFVDSLNDRVGISTTTPTSTLDVNGKITGSNFNSSLSTNVAAPSFAMGTTGIWSRNSSVRLNFAINGAESGVEVGTSLVALASTAYISWTSGTLASSNPDLFLQRDAANTLAQRNGAAGQSYRIYGTYTDASNYERIAVTANTTGHYIIGEEGGTGTARDLYLGANNATVVTVAANGNVGIGNTSPSTKFHVTSGGNVLKFPQTDGGDVGLQIESGGSGHAPSVHLKNSAGYFRLAVHSSDGSFRAYNGTDRLTILQNGNVGIGTATAAYKLEVNGSFAATTKSFIIDHQSKPDHRLRYGSLEGPENGVYVRGKSTNTIIELPDYWTWLVDEDTITVNITPIGKNQNLFVEKIENNKVYIKNNAWFRSDVNYFYTVYGERKDVEKLIAEIPK